MEENHDVDGAEVHNLLFGLGIALTGHRVNAKRLIKVVGESPELTEIIRTADESIEMIEKLMDLLFDFDDMET